MAVLFLFHALETGALVVPKEPHFLVSMALCNSLPH